MGFQDVSGSLGEITTIVRGAIIENDQLEILICLRKNTIEPPFEIGRMIVVGNNDANFWHSFLRKFQRLLGGFQITPTPFLAWL